MKRSTIGSFLLATFVALPVLAQEGGQPPQPTPPEGGAQPQPQPEGEGEGRREGRRQRGQRGGGGMMGGLGLPVERMRELLGLSEEQVAQMQALAAEMRAKGEELRGLFQGGDFESARAKMQELRTELEKKRDEILTEEQKKKLQENMRELGGRMRGAFGGEGRGGRGGQQNKARLREEAIRALALTPEEQAVVMPLLDTVLDTRELLQREGETRREAFLRKVRETTDQQALATLLADYRKSRETDLEQVKAASSQLREVLTVEQEAKLVGLNILD